jgi:hypothetical protein
VSRSAELAGDTLAFAARYTGLDLTSSEPDGDHASYPP